MTEKKPQSMLYWLIKQPLKFAITSFLLMVVMGFGYGIISTIFSNSASTNPNGVLTLLMALAFALSALLLWKGMSKEDINQKNFVAISNAQIFILSLLFISSTTLILIYSNSLLLKLMWLEANSSLSLIALVAGVALFYLYLCGIFLSNLYVKYQRCKTIGIKPWEIICSMPLGFGLFWIPGYILPEETKQKNKINAKASSWYGTFTNWILSHPLKTVISFLIMVILSGFFIGFNMVLVTLGLSIICGLWIKITGVKKFQSSINDTYAKFAIALNFILLICLICASIYLSAPRITNVQFNISDVPVTTSVTTE